MYPLLTDRGLPEVRTFRPNGDPYLSLLRPRARNIGDFRPIFEASRSWRQNTSARPYDPTGLTEGRSTFVYTPVAAMLVWPLAGDGWTVRHAADVVHAVNRVLWVAAGLMLFGILTYGVRWTRWTAAAFAIAYVAFYPVAKAIDLTQAQVWIWFLLVLTAWLLQRGHHAPAGVALGLGLSIKPHLVLVAVLLALVPRASRRLLAACVFTCAALALLSLVWVGWRNLADYLFEALPALSNGYAYYRNQSLNGVLLRLGGYADPSVFDLAPPVAWVRLVTGGFALGLLAVTAGVLRRARSVDPLLSFSLAVTVVTIASPVAWTHHYTALTLGFCLLARQALCEPLAVPSAVQRLGLVSFVLTGCLYDSRFLSGFPLGLLSGFEFTGAMLLIVCLLSVTARAGRVKAGALGSTDAVPAATAAAS